MREESRAMEIGEVELPSPLLLPPPSSIRLRGPPDCLWGYMVESSSKVI
jgi:hypothetical protein